VVQCRGRSFHRTRPLMRMARSWKSRLLEARLGRPSRCSRPRSDHFSRAWASDCSTGIFVIPILPSSAIPLGREGEEVARFLISPCT
jgi:hypothetical protein